MLRSAKPLGSFGVGLHIVCVFGEYGREAFEGWLPRWVGLSESYGQI